jgi:hypothetical protein
LRHLSLPANADDYFDDEGCQLLESIAPGLESVKLDWPLTYDTGRRESYVELLYRGCHKVKEIDLGSMPPWRARTPEMFSELKMVQVVSLIVTFDLISANPNITRRVKESFPESNLKKIHFKLRGLYASRIVDIMKRDIEEFPELEVVMTSEVGGERIL